MLASRPIAGLPRKLPETQAKFGGQKVASAKAWGRDKLERNECEAASVSFGEQAGIRKPVAMNSEKVEIERPGTSDALVKFASLPLQVYSDLPVRWQHDVAVEVDLISGRSPIASHLELPPLWARKKNRVVARVTAAVNHRYNRHWNEKLGQLIQFEAMPH